MKKKFILIISALMLLLLIGSVFAYRGDGEMRGKGFGEKQGGQAYTLYDDTQINHQMEIDTYPTEELSVDEISGLLLMREEEKLARDVYLELYDIYGQQIFSNIARSEATHTTAIKSLLDKYNISDPMTTDERGVFENDDLQNLYDQLVEKGSSSLVDALIVGVTIEDLDIKDLIELNELADNQDITTVYNNLEKGSRNHLRSFTKLLDRNGGSYIPQFISQEEYDLIISGDMETGHDYDSKGSNSQQGNNQENSIQQRNGQNAEGVQQASAQNSRNIFSKMWGGFKSWFN